MIVTKTDFDFDFDFDNVDDDDGIEDDNAMTSMTSWQ